MKGPCHVVPVTFLSACVAEQITVVCRFIIKKKMKTSLSWDCWGKMLYVYHIPVFAFKSFAYFKRLSFIRLTEILGRRASTRGNIIHCTPFRSLVEHNPHPPEGGVSLQSVQYIYILSESLTYRVPDNLTRGRYGLRRVFRCTSLTEQLRFIMNFLQLVKSFFILQTA